VRILLDTHCWLWWVVDPDRLSASAQAAIANADNAILLSAVSSWEIAIKHSIGKLALPEPPEQFVPKRLARDGISSLPIEHSHALRVAALPYHHHDPFDRLLIAQAQVERIALMTVDPQFRPYEVKLIWAS
jgi:PIN domain nuclease of toxin-antitoxin system